MKLLSFIFSSESLKLERGLPLGALAALVMVVLANVWAYKAQKAGLIYTSIPRQMVEESIDRLASAHGTWWLGNSTLAAGLDKDVVDRVTGDGNAYVELGSATLDVQVRLAATALSRRESGPERIVFFVTKDDLNAGGSRAAASSSYMQAFDNPGLYEIVASYFPVYSCRYAIVDKLRDGVASLLQAGGGQAHAAKQATAGKERFRDLGNEVDTTYLHNLGRNFREIDVQFEELSGQVSRTGSSVILVAPPVTRSIAAWQERYAPRYSWQRLAENLRERAESSGIRMYDFSGLLESTTENFKDVYHLNSRGALKFTRFLLEDSGILADTPRDEAS